MNEIQINSFADLNSYVESLDQNMKSIFRGVRDSEKHKLTPSIVRGEFYGDPSLERNERRMLKLFKESALPYLDFRPSNDWEWLAVAQHYGLPTRLLDWTTNPLAAAFFAVENQHDGDSAIYVYSDIETVNIEDFKDPFTIDKVYRYRPPHITNRIPAQGGLFTIHDNPSEPLSSENIEKLIISNQNRLEIKKILYKYGINSQSLFPGLESIASDIEWLHYKMH